MEIILLLCISALFGNVLAAEEPKNNVSFEVPEYILPCKRHDPNLNTCLRGTFNHLRPYLVGGLRDIDVPSIDPLEIEKLVMENGHGAVRVKAVFSNVTVNGASNYSIGNIKADVRNLNIELSMKLPKIEIRGKYEVAGNVLLFPVRSRGDFWAIFLDVDAAARFYGKEVYNKQKVKFMKIEKMFVDFQLQKSRFRVRDIINNGNIIGEAMNQFLNTNANEIIAEMKPAASKAIARHFKHFLNSAFLKVPMQVWLPEDQA